ncbi:MAG: hypothetical protein ACK5MH_09475 [Bacteroidales bacterium]
MKQFILMLFFVLISSVLYSQNTNPYKIFGCTSVANYEIPLANLFRVSNSDLDSDIKVLAIDFDKSLAYLLGENDSIIKTLNISPEEVLIWLSTDPMSDKYPSHSPYHYCSNNPIMRVDPNGMSDNPVYDRQGNFLGTDDKGLKGKGMVMDRKNFKQGMSHAEAAKYDLGFGGLENEDARTRFTNHYSDLPNRPDWDGYLTLSEANDWYRNGNGQPLFTDLNQIDLSGVYSLGKNYVGDEKVINLITNSASINDGLVYGNITLKRYPNNQVRAYSDPYDFDMKSWLNPVNWGRNIETKIGQRVAGQGTNYEINIYGSKTLKPILPWVR